MTGVVKSQPACRNCGATVKHALSRCPRCGKRSWSNLVAGWFQRH